MPALDQTFWSEALKSVHIGVLDPLMDWPAWAREVLERAERHTGRDMSTTSRPDPDDNMRLDVILQRMKIPTGREEDALDLLWHRIRDGKVAVSNDLNETIFFLLYRLVERGNVAWVLPPGG